MVFQDCYPEPYPPVRFDSYQCSSGSTTYHGSPAGQGAALAALAEDVNATRAETEGLRAEAAKLRTEVEAAKAKLAAEKAEAAAAAAAEAEAAAAAAAAAAAEAAGEEGAEPEAEA